MHVNVRGEVRDYCMYEFCESPFGALQWQTSFEGWLC